MARPLILYYAPTACSIAPHIALEEVGVAFEPRRIDLAKGEQGSPEFLSLSPLGRVPTMIIERGGDRGTRAADLYREPRAGGAPDAAAGHPCLRPVLRIARIPVEHPSRRLCPVPPSRSVSSLKGLRRGTNSPVRAGRKRSVLSRSRAPPVRWLGCRQSYSIADINLFPFFTWAWRLDFDVRNECPNGRLCSTG